MHENKQKPYWSLSFEIWTANLAVVYPGHPNKLTELHLWRLRLEILQSCYPVGTLKPDIHMWLLLIWDYYYYFLYAFIFEWQKNQNLLDIQQQRICKLGKIQSWNFYLVLLLIFKVVYQDHLTHLLPFAWDFIAKRRWLVWGQVG